METIVKNLITLTQGASIGDLTSLEALVRVFHHSAYHTSPEVFVCMHTHTLP